MSKTQINVLQLVKEQKQKEKRLHNASLCIAGYYPVGDKKK